MSALLNHPFDSWPAARYNYRRPRRWIGIAFLGALLALGAVVSGAAGQQVVDCGSYDPKRPDIKGCDENNDNRSWHLMQRRANGSVVAEGLSAKLTKHECEQAAASINPKPKFTMSNSWSRTYMPEDVMTAECFQ